MKATIRLMALLAAATPVLLSATAEAKDPQPISPKLTPRLHELLTKEMEAIRQAVNEIVDGMISGDNVRVAKNGDAIFDGFILRQSLSDQDRKDLEKAVPPEFFDLDHEFHVMGMKLALAAANKDPDLQQHYLGKMIAACAQCHSKYVSDKFPLFQHRPAAAPMGGHGH